MPARRGWKAVAGGAGALAMLVSLLRAQPGPPAGTFSGRTASGSNVYARVRDAATGLGWVLLRGAGDCGGPGRWVQIAGGSGLPSGSAPRLNRPGRPVIQAGDRVLLEEHTAVAAMRLEAVALEPAAAGARLRIRLAAAGRTRSAVALGAGRAELVGGRWEQP